MDQALALPAFVAGILMFFAPCTFPLVPAFLGIISGIAPGELSRSSGAVGRRGNVLFSAFLFVAGFTSVFVLFGTAAAWGGQFLFPYRRILTRLAGVFIILFGCSLLGLFRIPLFRGTKSLRAVIPGIASRPLHAFLVGAAFGTGWTPCVGPVLGTVLLLATTASSAAWGAALLGIFSLGLAIPFLLTALALGFSAKVLNRLSRFARSIEVAAGLTLILLGALVFEQKFALLIHWGYGFFKFLHYEKLLDYL